MLFALRFFTDKGHKIKLLVEYPELVRKEVAEMEDTVSPSEQEYQLVAV